MGGQTSGNFVIAHFWMFCIGTYSTRKTIKTRYSSFVRRARSSSASRDTAVHIVRQTNADAVVAATEEETTTTSHVTRNTHAPSPTTTEHAITPADASEPKEKAYLEHCLKRKQKGARKRKANKGKRRHKRTNKLFVSSGKQSKADWPREPGHVCT